MEYICDYLRTAIFAKKQDKPSVTCALALARYVQFGLIIGSL